MQIGPENQAEVMQILVEIHQSGANCGWKMPNIVLKLCQLAQILVSKMEPPRHHLTMSDLSPVLGNALPNLA